MVIEGWFKKDKKTKKYEKGIVIFIDELDRCSDKGITKPFEVLQLFLSLEQIVIVLSINDKDIKTEKIILIII